MLVNRRQFLAATGLAAAAAAGWAPPVLARRLDTPTWFDWKTPADGVHVAFNEGGNAMVLRGRAGALLVDCKNAPFGAALRREAEGLGAALTTVINTHHHADHTAGNSAFVADLPVLAHQNARERVLAQTERYLGMIRGGVAQVSRSSNPARDRVLEDARSLAERAERLRPEDFAPTRPVGEYDELEVGGRTVALHHFGAGHTDNDLVVHVPALNVVHTGDLLFHRLHPFMDVAAGANSTGWIASLQRIIALCNERTVVIPGHGELTGVDGVRRQIEYFERTRDAVAAAVRQGQSREQIEAIELADFRDYGFERIRSRVLGAIYDELTKPGP